MATCEKCGRYKLCSRVPGLAMPARSAEKWCEDFVKENHLKIVGDCFECQHWIENGNSPIKNKTGYCKHLAIDTSKNFFCGSWSGKDRKHGDT